MKTRLIAVILLSLLPAGVILAAQKAPEKKAAPPKTPADLASDEFNKVIREPAGKQLDQARFQKVIGAGISFLSQYPTHWNANNAIRELPAWGGSVFKDKNQSPQRVAYLSLLKFELLNARYKEGLSNDAKAALAALEASTIDAETRELFTKSNLDALREKLDALGAMPGAGRYLVDREKSYIDILTKGAGPDRAEEHLQRLAKHTDKGVAGMAQQELKIAEARKAPLQLAFTGIDGKPFDVAQHRGKVVALYYWNLGTRDNLKNMEWLKQMMSAHRKKGFEAVAVSLDKEEDQPKVQKFLKDNRITFPVHFDGKGTKSEVATKLNVTGTPRLFVFDKAGMLQSAGILNNHSLQMGQLDNAIKVLTEPPKKK